MTTFLTDTSVGIDKFGYNGDVDAAEDIWSGGGDFDWTKVAANAATTIESSDDADNGATATGALTVEVEGLVSETRNGVTGGRIYKEVVTLDGTEQITLSNSFMFVYRARVLTVGSGGSNAGTITVKHATDIIARIEIGINQTEMALMIVPHFDREGGAIQRAYLHSWYASVVTNTTANAGIAIMSAPSGTLAWAINRRGVITVDGDLVHELAAPIGFSPGTKIKVRATSVSAVNQTIAAGFLLEYK